MVENDLNKKQFLTTNQLTFFAVLWFVLIFGALVTIASLLDLQISIFLTKGTLIQGQYFSTSQFGLFFETMGSAPIWVLGAIAAIIFLWNAARGKNKPLSIILPIILAVLSVLLLYFFYEGMLGYMFEKVDAENYTKVPYVIAIAVFMSAITAGLIILAFKFVKPETAKILMKFALVIVCTAVFYLLIDIIKSPVGRIRFRTMNAIGDSNFYNFTDWWVINGKRAVPNLPSDNCKSFPSGHTFSAGVIYSLICLPYLLPSLNRRWIKITLLAGTIVYTGVVGVSRIVVGAHFMSDVLFGGTIAFLAAMLFKEIFVDKCKHFIALKNIKKKEKVDEEETVEEVK